MQAGTNLPESGRGSNPRRTITPAVIREMRDWIAECSWADLVDRSDIDALPDYAVLRGIERHYAGGLIGWMDSYPAESGWENCCGRRNQIAGKPCAICGHLEHKRHEVQS